MDSCFFVVSSLFPVEIAQSAGFTFVHSYNFFADLNFHLFFCYEMC